LVRRLFELRPWYKMVPTRRSLTQEDGLADQAARAEAGVSRIRRSPLSIMDTITGTKVKAHWYDPRNGKWHEIGEYPNTGVREFAPPSKGDRDDWVGYNDAEGYPSERSGIWPLLHLTGGATAFQYRCSAPAVAVVCAEAQNLSGESPDAR
jgi:hypothetical protein